MYKSFKEMPVWRKALELSVKVFKLSATLPKCEDYGLTSQIRRSSNSVTGNIAEAFGRKIKKDKGNFYIIARGSACETQSHLLYGQKVGCFQEFDTEEIINAYNELAHELNKILKSLDC